MNKDVQKVLDHMFNISEKYYYLRVMWQYIYDDEYENAMAAQLLYLCHEEECYQFIEDELTTPQLRLYNLLEDIALYGKVIV